MVRDKRKSSTKTPESEESASARISPESAGGAPEGDVSIEYEVEKIVSHKVEPNGVIKYRISWVGYPSNEDSFAGEDELAGAAAILETYKKKHNLIKNKNAASTRTRTRGSSPAASNKKDAGSDDQEVVITPGSSRKHMRGASSASATPEEVALEDPSTVDSDDGASSLASLRRTPRGRTSKSNTSTRPTRSSQPSAKAVEKIPSPAHSKAGTPLTAPSANGTAKRRREVSKEKDTPAKKKRNDTSPAPSAVREQRSAWLTSESPEASSELRLPVSSRVANNFSPVSRLVNSHRSTVQITKATPTCGLFNHIEVEQVSHIKCIGGGNVAVKVTYKDAPAPFQKFDYIDIRFVRHFAPQKVIDHLLSLVTPDSDSP